MPAPYSFLRTILAPDRSWSAVDWQSSTPASSAEFLERYSESAAAPLAHLLTLVTPVTPEFLDDAGFIRALGVGRAIFVLPEASLTNATLLARCKALRKEGQRIDVHLQTADLVRELPASAFDFVELNSAFARQDLHPSDLVHRKEAGLRKIATNVGSHEMFAWLSGHGFELCDSHFLAAHSPHSGKEPDLTRLKLLKLLNLVQQDSDTRLLEEIFREEPKLSYNLLRLVNSVAVGARTKISNFSQAIAILGRRQLQRWLQLLIYANNLADGHEPNPLMQLAAARGRQMELLAAAIDPAPAIKNLVDNAFLVGLFSLLDVLVNLPMNEILKDLPMQDEVLEALKSQRSDGVLGELLSAISAAEAGNFIAAETILSRLGVSAETHLMSQVTALYWAARINIQIHD